MLDTNLLLWIIIWQIFNISLCSSGMKLNIINTLHLYSTVNYERIQSILQNLQKKD